MKWIKRSALSLIILLLILLGFYFSDLVYGLRQLQGQLKIIRGAVDLQEYLDNPANPDSIKQKLRVVTRVKKFAVENLDFPPTENYTTVYDQKGEDILWVTTASLPYKLEPKLWKFPFLGEVSYKGHFNLERAIKEAKDLEAQNWDVSVRVVTAWSTLGWFDDPVLTGMLDRSQGEIAELILHELTHGVLYVRDSVDFNENLASFVGVKAAQMFLIAEYGLNSSEFNDYMNLLQDDKKMIRYMLLGTKKLDSLYSSFTGISDTAVMHQLKNELINSIVLNMDTISFANKSGFQNFFQKRKPNNAYFMNFIRYNSMEDQFEFLLQNRFEGDIKSFLNFFRTNYPSL